MHGQKSKFVVTWLTSVSLICFKHVIDVLPFSAQPNSHYYFSLWSWDFFSDGPWLYLESASLPGVRFWSWQKTILFISEAGALAWVSHNVCSFSISVAHMYGLMKIVMHCPEFCFFKYGNPRLRPFSDQLWRYKLPLKRGSKDKKVSIPQPTNRTFCSSNTNSTYARQFSRHSAQHEIAMDQQENNKWNEGKP